MKKWEREGRNHPEILKKMKENFEKQNGKPAPEGRNAIRFLPSRIQTVVEGQSLDKMVCGDEYLEDSEGLSRDGETPSLNPEVVKPIHFDERLKKVEEAQYPNEEADEIRNKRPEHLNDEEGDNKRRCTKLIKPIAFEVSVLSLSDGRVFSTELDPSNPMLYCGYFIKKEEAEILFNIVKGYCSSKEGKEAGAKHLYERILNFIMSRSNMRTSLSVGSGHNNGNFSIVPRRVKRYKNRYGVEVTEKSIIESELVFPKDNVKHMIELHYREIDNLLAVIQKRFPEAVSFDKKQDLSDMFRLNIKDAAVLDAYFEAGWNVINGCHVYLSAESTIPSASVDIALSLPIEEGYTKESLVEVVDKALKLYKDGSTMNTLFLFACLGVLYRCFNEAGHSPHFVLFIVGSSGSYKTSLAKLLYTQLAEDGRRDNPRRFDDTTVSLERAIVVSGIDTTTLIDDYYPANTQTEVQRLRKNLDMIIRTIGDGSSKSRSDPSLSDHRGDGVKGVVAVTGELDARGYSTSLRCIRCELDKQKVDLSVLDYFVEKRPRAFSTLIRDFADHLGMNWDKVVQNIKAAIPYYRQEGAKILQQGRLIDCYAVLGVTAEIFCTYYAAIGGGQMLLENMKRTVMDQMVHAETWSKKEDPVEIYFENMKDLYASNELKVYEKSEVEHRTLNHTDGVIIRGELYFFPEKLYSKVIERMRKAGLLFALDCTQISRALCERGIAEYMANGKGKRTAFRRINICGKRVKALKVALSALSEIDIAEQQSGIDPKTVNGARL